jgi:hypothetical protein
MLWTISGNYSLVNSSFLLPNKTLALDGRPIKRATALIDGKKVSTFFGKAPTARAAHPHQLL